MICSNIKLTSPGESRAIGIHDFCQQSQGDQLPDADAKAREYRRFVDDLKIAAAPLRKSARAA